MNKIPSLFMRDFDNDPRYVTHTVNPVCQWVADGEGLATEKIDGTACMVRDGNLYARYDRKHGKPAPDGWESCQPQPDPLTGHWPGWVPVRDQPEYKWHREAFVLSLPNGTYELIGPKVQGNPYGLPHHAFQRHGSVTLPNAPRDFDGLKAYLTDTKIEGIVWHHPDGRMVKIKARDFGIKWPR